MKCQINIRSYNDLDHLAPVVYGLLVRGHSTVVRIQSSAISVSDPRLKWVNDNFPSCSVSKSGIGSLIHDRMKRSKSITFLLARTLLDLIFCPRLRPGMDAYVFEWSEPTFAERLHMLWRRLRVVALPHGLNIYLNSDFNEALASVESENKAGPQRTPDFQRRSAFTYYVVQTEKMRLLIESWGLSSDKLRVLSSLRFTETWINNLDQIWKDEEIDPAFKDWSASHKGYALFLLPHWSYNVKYGQVIDLLSSLSDRSIPIVIRAHTRGTGSLPADQLEKLASSSTFYSESIPTSHLIRLASCVISFGSSVALEALTRGIPLINPRHLHGNSTIFDNMDGVFQVSSNLAAIEAVMLITCKEQSETNQTPKALTEPSFSDLLASYEEIVFGRSGNS